MLAVLVFLVVGSVWGDDDAFPFAPFKMYSRATDMNGAVNTPRLLGVTTDGREVRLDPARLGLRPADLEGQYRYVRTDPSLLEALAGAYEPPPGGAELAEIRLVRVRRQLRDGHVVSRSIVEVASWPVR